MVGTGIFTTPGYVLSLTNGKGLSLFLWGLGGVYAALCLVIYLDYGTAMPFNGGELIYFNKVWGRPKLLSAVLFSGYFISLGHTSGNSIAFARQVILASQPPGVPEDGTQPDDSVFDSRLVNFIALTVLGAVCLLHYFTKRLGLFLNRVSAFYKVALLFVVAFLAFGVRIPHIDFEWQDRSPSNFKPFDSVAGFIYITYSYSGWENANYVIGELQAKPRTFRLGAFTALSIVTLGYVLVTLGYFLACSTLSIQNGADLGMAMILAPKFQINGGHIGLQVCIAISAFGNLIADVYTSCRVKQAIALHNIIPFSKFFAADSKSFGTPGGALLLHWILSAIVIVSIPSTSDGYGFVVGLFTYGQLGIGVFMGVLYYTLDKGIDPEQGWNPLLQGKWPKVIVGFTLAIANFMILVVAALPNNAGEIPRWMWPVTLAGVFGSSVIYWCLLKAFGGCFGRKLGWSATVKVVKHDNDFQKMEHEHRRDGTKQRYEWTRGSRDNHWLVRWAQKIQRGAKWVGKYI
ncbi:hypothetical protein IFR05_008372 [Cadophora sp. M221]|nr:hypothetical protein IFR05_008372 [Cadophora sp. M221]